MEKAGAFKVQTLQMGWFVQFRRFYKLHFSNHRLLCENYTAKHTHAHAGICIHAKKEKRKCYKCKETHACVLRLYYKYMHPKKGTWKHTIGPFSRCVVSKPPHSCAALEAPSTEGMTQTGSKQFPYTVTDTHR